MRYPAFGDQPIRRTKQYGIALPLARVSTVPIEHLSFIWPQARVFIEKALALQKVRRFDAADILNLLLEGKVRLWVSWDPDLKRVEAAIVTEILQYPRMRELLVWLVGSNNMKACAREAYDLLEAFARDSGCAVISGRLRRGWIRIGGAGWYETGASFEKRLDVPGGG